MRLSLEQIDSRLLAIFISYLKSITPLFWEFITSVATLSVICVTDPLKVIHICFWAVTLFFFFKLYTHWSRLCHRTQSSPFHIVPRILYLCSHMLGITEGPPPPPSFYMTLGIWTHSSPYTCTPNNWPTKPSPMLLLPHMFKFLRFVLFMYLYLYKCMQYVCGYLWKLKRYRLYL